MINYFEAIAIIINSIGKSHRLLKSKKIKTGNAVNEISADDIFSNKNIPNFRNSAMDGYAMNITQFESIRDNYVFNYAESIKAGDFFESVKTDSVEIMTGARIPSKLNSVIKFEDTKKIDSNHFLIKKIPKINDHIKTVGEDFKIGDKIISKGKILDSYDVMALATFGIKYIKVISKPKIFLINTGNEIMSDVSYTRIHNSSKMYITSFLEGINFSITNISMVKDNFKNFINKVKFIWSFKNKNLFITTGAVSKGKSDFIPTLLKYIGVKIIFHSVNIKPGKPILFAIFKSHIYFFCLPGNPISTIIGIRFFLCQFLRLLLGQNLEEPFKGKCIMKKTLTKDTFLKSYVYQKYNRLYINICKEQESFKIKQMLKTNAFTFVTKKKYNKYYGIYFSNFFI